MPEEQIQTTETVEPAAQAAVVEDATNEEAFDKERALLTIHKLREAEKKGKQDAKELAILKADAAKRAEAEMTEADKLKKMAEDAKAENERLKADILKRDVATETGLPAFFIDRLRGDTREDMLADALELLKALPQQKVNPKVNNTNPANGSTQITDDERRAFLGLRR